jgi:hypothetical protein
MFSHRFEHLMNEQLPPKNVGVMAFVPLPVAIHVASQGNELWRLLYQIAFEQAHKEMMADRRAHIMTPSLN